MAQGESDDPASPGTQEPNHRKVAETHHKHTWARPPNRRAKSCNVVTNLVSGHRAAPQHVRQRPNEIEIAKTKDGEIASTEQAGSTDLTDTNFIEILQNRI